MRRAWVVLLAACCHHPDPKIKSFTVEPHSYCPGLNQKIHIAWDTEKGDATLQVGHGPPRKVDPKGETFEDAKDMTVTLTLTSGDLAPNVAIPVKHVEGHALDSMVPREGCHDGWATAASADLGGGPNAFAANVHPSVISNLCAPGASETATCRRNVRVEHAGKTWTLGPNETKDIRSDAVPAAGAWTLSQELEPGEECGTPSVRPATEVVMSVDIDCTNGGSDGK